ncbi:MAG: leucine-rich repeat domain-containing protein [Eubacteriales bacterium]
MKKTIKNIFGLILITIMILSVSVANADNNFGISLFSGTSSSDSNSIPGTSDLYYSFEDGVLSIYGSGKVPASLSATWTSSKTVKFNPGGVTEIIIEEGITGINERLTRPFKNNTISVTLPSSLEYIAESTFNNYTKLETVTIPDNSKLKYIYTSAFEKCTSLKNINLPEGLESIYSRAFISCSNLTNLTLPSTLTRIDEIAFSNGPRFKNNELTVPKGVTTITSRSFENIKDLKTINVENGVTKIEGYAFADNDSLTRINLPSSITSVEYTACKYYAEEKYATCDIYIDKYKGSIRCPSNWGTTGTIYWKARDFKNTTDNTVVISDVADQTYTGSLIAPNVTVTCNDVELVKDTDYTVSYSNNKNVGTATISITGIGDYTGTIKKNFNIVARGISDTTIGSIPNQTYTGNSISALPVITYNGATLTKDVDYTLSYSNNINVGTATITITGKGNFKGTTSKTFSISARAMTDTSVANVSSQTYTGNVISPLPTITYNNKTLKKDTDYTLSYSNNINAGTATITITGKGNFTGTTSKTFSISARAMSDTSVANISSQTYTGNVISPLPTITYNNKTLKKDTDYTLSYSDNINVGTATITITGKGNFAGTTSKTFSISARAMSDTSVANISSQTYTGNVISPLPTITYNNKTLKKDTDYTLSYSDNINVGTATITITGKGNFTGMTSTTFIITQKSAEKLNISEIANQIYTGKEIKPNIVVTDTER